MKAAALILFSTRLLAAPSSPPLLSESQGQKPVRVVETYLDGGPAEPKSLDALLRLSPVVVEGTVESVRHADKNIDIPEFNRYDVLVLTAYPVIREVFKSPRNLNLSETLEVFLPVGTRDKGSFIEETVVDRIQPLRLGETYILFLAGTGEGEGFRLATTRDSSVVRLEQNGRATPLDVQSAIASVARPGASELRAALRAKGR